jgi:hypothetical protein
MAAMMMIMLAAFVLLLIPVCRHVFYCVLLNKQHTTTVNAECHIPNNDIMKQKGSSDGARTRNSLILQRGDYKEVADDENR